jgi:hypothetical protein
MDSSIERGIVINVAARPSGEEADPNAGVEPVAVEAETRPTKN